MPGYTATGTPSDGEATITTQNYSHLENIMIRVSDDMGRSEVSGLIVMRSIGQHFTVSLPDTAVVGGPSSFPIAIELIDSATGNRVNSHTGLVNLTVRDAATGRPIAKAWITWRCTVTWLMTAVRVTGCK